MRISSFIIGFLVISLITVSFSFFIGALDEKYTVVDVNESSLGTYDKVDELTALSAEMNASLQQIQSNNPLDVVGGMLTSGFTVMKTTWSSFGVYTDVTSAAVDAVDLGETAITFKSVALVIGILLFIFAMVGILTGRVI